MQVFNLKALGMSVEVSLMDRIRCKREHGEYVKMSGLVCSKEVWTRGKDGRLIGRIHRAECMWVS